MTTIKPAGAVATTAAIEPGLGAASTAATVRAGEVAGAPGADPTAAALAAFRAGAIGPDEAVQRLTRAAVAKTGCAPELWPSIERKMASLLARDPTLGALVRQVGARVPSDEG